MLIYLSLLHTKEEKSKFETLYHSYRHTMYYVANGILQDHTLAEDAVHEAFIRIAKNLHKIGEIDCSQTKGFVVIIVKNVALTMVKQESKVMAMDMFEHMEGMSTEIEGYILHQSDLEIIVQSVFELSATYRNVLYLHILDEYSIAEIAHMLKLPRETVKKRLQRGRKALAANLVKKGVSSGEG